MVKAEAALARLTAFFETKSDKVADAEAEQRLAEAEAKASRATTVMKAQKQRWAKAQARLAECGGPPTA